jgi:hypothetical protein
MTTDAKIEQRRVREDREREQYVRTVMDEITTVHDRTERDLIRVAINSAWINGRNQILTRGPE